MGRNARRRSEARRRASGSCHAAVAPGVAQRSGRIWTSVIGSVLVTVLLLIEDEPRAWRRSWAEWSSLWTTSPRTTPDAVHFQIFLGWMWLAYPLFVLMTVVFWWVDAQTDVVPGRWVYFGLVGFALVSGALHYYRGMAVDRPTVTRGAQLLAGWPQEAILLAVLLGAAQVIIGP